MPGGNAMRTPIAVVGVLLAAPASFARPPPDVVPDPAIHAWFEGLRQPGQALPCCSISDCRVMASRLRDEVEIEGYRYIVPNSAVIRNILNLMEGAVVCYTYSAFGPPAPEGGSLTEPQDMIEILCFVPPHPLS